AGVGPFGGGLPRRHGHAAPPGGQAPRAPRPADQGRPQGWAKLGRRGGRAGDSGGGGLIPKGPPRRGGDGGGEGRDAERRGVGRGFLCELGGVAFWDEPRRPRLAGGPRAAAGPPAATGRATKGGARSGELLAPRGGRVDDAARKGFTAKPHACGERIGEVQG